MNEGHAGFLGIERIREFMTADNLDFDTALTVVRASTVFTTHTPVPAGIDRFPVEMVRRYFDDDSKPACCTGFRCNACSPSAPRTTRRSSTWPTWACAWRSGPTGSPCCTAASAARCSTSCGRASTRPRCPSVRSPTGCTHPPGRRRRWLELGRELAGSTESCASRTCGSGCSRWTPGHIWWIRSQLRARLIEDVRARLRRSWLERGAAEAELGWIATAFDPDVLTIGFARRVPTYKRLTLMLRDPERLRALLLDESKPLQLIVAGKSHPADDAGKALIQQVVRFADAPDVRHRIAFLPDYDMSMARLLYWGCDVWLNNPLRPLEACGTSGMKSALNGGLNLSIRDGWWDEWYDGENGWEIPTADGLADEGRRDDLEASALYNLLERSVGPKFYDRDDKGVPTRWVEMVRHTLQTLGPKVLASRMVREYTEKYYAPAAASLRRTIAPLDGLPFGAARELAAYRLRAREAWPRIEITDVDSTGLPDTPAARLGADADRCRAAGRPDPDEVAVQAVLGRVDAGDALLEPALVDMTHTGPGDGGTEVFSTTTRFRWPDRWAIPFGCCRITRCWPVTPSWAW